MTAPSQGSDDPLGDLARAERDAAWAERDAATVERSAGFRAGVEAAAKCIRIFQDIVGWQPGESRNTLVGDIEAKVRALSPPAPPQEVTAADALAAACFDAIKREAAATATPAPQGDVLLPGLLHVQREWYPQDLPELNTARQFGLKCWLEAEIARSKEGHDALLLQVVFDKFNEFVHREGTRVVDDAGAFAEWLANEIARRAPQGETRKPGCDWEVSEETKRDIESIERRIIR